MVLSFRSVSSVLVAVVQVEVVSMTIDSFSYASSLWIRKRLGHAFAVCSGILHHFTIVLVDGALRRRLLLVETPLSVAEKQEAKEPHVHHCGASF